MYDTYRGAPSLGLDSGAGPGVGADDGQPAASSLPADETATQDRNGQLAREYAGSTPVTGHLDSGAINPTEPSLSAKTKQTSNIILEPTLKCVSGSETRFETGPLWKINLEKINDAVNLSLVCACTQKKVWLNQPYYVRLRDSHKMAESSIKLLRKS